MIAGAVMSFAFAACTVRSNNDDDDDAGSTTHSVTSTTTGSGMTPEPATVADACNGIADRELQCDGSTDFDRARCVAAEACFRIATRDEAEQPLLDCYAGWSAAPDCDGAWCTERVATQLQPMPEHVAHVQRCAEFDSTCGSSGGDICTNATSLYNWEPSLVAQFATCFDLGCSQDLLEDCVSERVSAYLAQCGGQLGRLL